MARSTDTSFFRARTHPRLSSRGGGQHYPGGLNGGTLNRHPARKLRSLKPRRVAVSNRPQCDYARPSPAYPAWGEGRCAADAVFVCASRRPQCAGDANCRRCNSIAAAWRSMFGMLSPLPRRSDWAHCFAHFIQPCQPSPIWQSGRPAHCPFRGLLGVHSRYGLHTRAVTVFRDTLSEGFSHFVTSIAAPVASGWSGCRVGFAPTGKRRLFTAHATSRHSAKN